MPSPVHVKKETSHVIQISESILLRQVAHRNSGNKIPKSSHMPPEPPESQGKVMLAESC